MNIAMFSAPSLGDIRPLLSELPVTLHRWIASTHVSYLDNRIHKIDRLTQYLAECSAVEPQRNEFIDFVLTWTRKANPTLEFYLKQYSERFSSVRTAVDGLCDEFLASTRLTLKVPIDIQFWTRFAAANELDSVHGMFLTSGRWYVNVMLPAIKELIYCFLSGFCDVHEQCRNDLSFHIARRVITPRFAEVPPSYDKKYERMFAVLLMPLLQHFDRRLCFLFEMLAELPNQTFAQLDEFVDDVAAHPDTYRHLLMMGIYPPFAWHELQASRRPRRAVKSLEESLNPLLSRIPPEIHDRAMEAVACLTVLKDYELNYNNYNYKGRFGLISKFQYWITAEALPSPLRDRFLDAILLDRFYDALQIIKDYTH